MVRLKLRSSLITNPMLTYSIRVQAKDDYNATVEDNFMVTLTDDQHEDTDGDGFTDFQEISAGTDINDINSQRSILDWWLGIHSMVMHQICRVMDDMELIFKTLTRDRMGVDLKAGVLMDRIH